MRAHFNNIGTDSLSLLLLDVKHLNSLINNFKKYIDNSYSLCYNLYES